MALINKILSTLSIILVFIFVLTILIHTNTSLDQDLGRHIKTGEIIWQTKIIPKTNLFSYTYANFPFINHHWGSEVVFYLFYKYFGLLSITYLKIAIVFLAVILIFYTSVKISNLLVSLVSLTFFLPLLVSRTDERPEIFGLLFFSLFLAIFIKYRQENYTGRAVWLLPFVQLLWTNMHITFIYGFLLTFLFLIDIFFNKSSNSQNVDANKIHGAQLKNLSKMRYGREVGAGPDEKSSLVNRPATWILRADAFKNLIIIAIFSILFSLVNPNSLSGLLYPLNVFKNYGYTIVENQNLFYLSRLTSNIFIKMFWFQAAILMIAGIISFFLSLKHKSLKKDFFYLLLAFCFSFLSIIMLRNFPFFVFVAIICFSYFLKNIQLINSKKMDASKIHWPFRLRHCGKRGTSVSRIDSGQARMTAKSVSPWILRVDAFKNLLYLTTIFNLIFIYLITSNTFYNTFDINKKFEIKISSSYEKAVDFFINNKLPGPIFNNFDIGGYLDFRLCSKSSRPAGVDVGGPPTAVFSEDWGKTETGPAGSCVFIDNRPEAYPAAFFEEYKNAQLYPELMNELIKKYKINSIIFSHADATDWGTNLVRIADKLDHFKIVYTDANVIILTKKEFLISPISPLQPISPSSFQDYRELLNLARLYNLLNKNDLAFSTLEKAYQTNPSSCITRLNYGSFLSQQENLYLKNKGEDILKSAWYCPFPKK